MDKCRVWADNGELFRYRYKGQGGRTKAVRGRSYESEDEVPPAEVEKHVMHPAVGEVGGR